MRRATWLVIAGTLALPIQSSKAATEHVIHSFATLSDGATPCGTLVQNAAGDLYGTTYQGGAFNLGVVFKLGKSGYRVLYSFRGGSDGANPFAGVTLDSAGNLYGTTYYGGSGNAGVIYRFSPSGQETVLYSFSGGNDGANPYAGVILDSSGNLYGTTYSGGSSKLGVVYRLTPSGQQTVLHSFTGYPDGANPYAGVVMDPAGDLYGTTYNGGANWGVVYKLGAAGQESILYTFPGLTKPGHPRAGLMLDSAGNLYGTAGGAGGTIYKLSPTGQFTLLYQFLYGIGAQNPESILALDAAGNLYGTASVSSAGLVFRLDTAGDYQPIYETPGATPYAIPYNPGFPNAGVVLASDGFIYGVTPYAGVAGMIYKVSPSGQGTILYTFGGAAGGTSLGNLAIGPSGGLYGVTVEGGAANAGVAYRIDSGGKETVLYSFTGGLDGGTPNGRVAVAVDTGGNVYGATAKGGAANLGVIYKVDPSGQETVLHSFTGGADGGLPSGVVVDSTGTLYGTTFEGGGPANAGVVFKMDPSGQETVLYTFGNGADGGQPEAAVVLDAGGSLYGTTVSGGRGAGVVYRLDPAGHETVLYTFTGGVDGGLPFAGVIRDAAGNLYGTAADYGALGGGVVYTLSAAGQYSVLYSFPSGQNPMTGVVRDGAGNLYGATQGSGPPVCGGYPCGYIYEIGTSGQFTVIYTFPGGALGDASGQLTIDLSGNLYAPAAGGNYTGGLIFKLIQP